MSYLKWKSAAAFGLGAMLLAIWCIPAHSEAKASAAGSDTAESETANSAEPFTSELPPVPPVPEFVNKGIQWLVKAQHEDGGWGAGSSANQKNRDPRQVKIDPATTAFTASALVRAGHTPTSGEHREAVRRATKYLVDVVLKYDGDGPKITHLTGTQIQAKLGPLVDTVMTTQYLARILTLLPEEDLLRSPVSAALDRCVAKLESAQQKDGS
jgi:hypothetical protein